MLAAIEVRYWCRWARLERGDLPITNWQRDFAGLWRVVGRHPPYGLSSHLKSAPPPCVGSSSRALKIPRATCAPTQEPQSVGQKPSAPQQEIHTPAPGQSAYCVIQRSPRASGFGFSHQGKRACAHFLPEKANRLQGKRLTLGRFLGEVKCGARAGVGKAKSLCKIRPSA